MYLGTGCILGNDVQEHFHPHTIALVGKSDSSTLASMEAVMVGSNAVSWNIVYSESCWV